MKNITLQAKWYIKAPLSDVFNIMTNFEKFPQYFPKVAESINITKREENYLEMDATAKSFGKKFLVKMRTRILPGKGYISDNENSDFGTSGHEELFLSEHAEGAMISYIYQVTIHKRWLRIIAQPLIGWFSMWYWKKAVIDELKKKLEK